MKCGPAGLALLALHQPGHDIKPGTLHMWVNRGHITRGPGGYDLAEIVDYLNRRTAGSRSPDQVMQSRSRTSIG